MNTDPASAKDSTYRTMFGWCSLDRMRTSRATASANRAAASLLRVRLGKRTALLLGKHLLHGARPADVRGAEAAAAARSERAVHLAEGALAQALDERVPAHDAGSVRDAVRLAKIAGFARREARAPVVKREAVRRKRPRIRGLERLLERIRESRRALLALRQPPRRDALVPLEFGLVLPDVDERREEVRREQRLERDAHALAVARKNKTQRAETRARTSLRRAPSLSRRREASSKRRPRMRSWWSFPCVKPFRERETFRQ